MKVRREEIEGIIRHALTFVGGILVLKGILDDGMVNEIVGGALSVVGVVWSIMDKRKEAKQD